MADSIKTVEVSGTGSEGSLGRVARAEKGNLMRRLTRAASRTARPRHRHARGRHPCRRGGPRRGGTQAADRRPTGRHLDREPDHRQRRLHQAVRFARRSRHCVRRDRVARSARRPSRVGPGDRILENAPRHAVAKRRSRRAGRTVVRHHGGGRRGPRPDTVRRHRRAEQPRRGCARRNAQPAPTPACSARKTRRSTARSGRGSRSRR